MTIDRSIDGADSLQALVLEGEDCPRCGLAPDPRLFDAAACAACGGAPCRDDAQAGLIRAAREARRACLRWLMGPWLYLASLTMARGEILNRIGSCEERADDGARLDAIDAQVSEVFRCDAASRFRESISVLRDIVSLQDAFDLEGIP